jgi:hypothetical protein
MTKPFLLLILIFSFATLAFSQAISSADDNRQIVNPIVNESVSAPNTLSDGCTMWFNGEYRKCCEEHDAAYFKSDGWHARLQADNRLFKCVAKLGFGYSMVAPVMWLGVRIFGSPLFPFHKKRKVK